MASGKFWTWQNAHLIVRICIYLGLLYRVASSRKQPNNKRQGMLVKYLYPKPLLYRDGTYWTLEGDNIYICLYFAHIYVYIYILYIYVFFYITLFFQSWAELFIGTDPKHPPFDCRFLHLQTHWLLGVSEFPIGDNSPGHLIATNHWSCTKSSLCNMMTNI